MPASPSRSEAAALRREARIFAALGDETRMSLVAKLGRGSPLSIARLTEGQGVTRQSITKHLRILRGAGLVRSVRHGRENRFLLEPGAVQSARESLERISHQWDEALARLKASLES
jgi:DNA-binding transcriptional ArsR family regulator